jgi:hypothetical protein
MLPHHFLTASIEKMIRGKMQHSSTNLCAMVCHVAHLVLRVPANGTMNAAMGPDRAGVRHPRLAPGNAEWLD